ncbi:hypothetical protein KY284_009743 [Solanum tuberosum]|nr:hypothetical protein KY284_009743 [Solanum tuberosum]
MEKINSKTRTFFFICTFLGFLLIFLSRISVCSAAESDFYCLKSIKDSLQDPFNSLDSWDFSNANEGFICNFKGVNCWNSNENKLDYNNLEGEIPRRIGYLPRLKMFTVANNYLTGPVPSFISKNITAESFANNELCGKPLKGCEDSWIWKHIDRDSFIKAFVIGWFPVKIILLNKWKLRSMKHINSGSEEELISQQKILKLEKFVTRMSLKELEIATFDFNDDYLVGIGMFGKVYKAILRNGWTLAIKKLNDWENLEDEFVLEITTLGGLRHRNLLPLIGFCVEREKKLLVYKYMRNGSLHEWLHSNKDKAKILDFCLRVKIALGIAKALAWLHHGYKLHVTHGSISTRCILLDQNFEPKISNFWEAKIWSKNDAALSWSLFPVAEYSCLGSYKKDIYCFGVLLLELVTGKEPHELTSSRNLFDHSPCLLDADKDLLGKGINNLILEFLELACDCVKFLPNERPTMLKVYDKLKTISQGRNDD